MRKPTNEFARGSLLASGAAFVLAFTLAGCSHKAGGDAEEGGGEKAPPAVVEVTLTKVTRADISQDIAISGNIAALPNRDVRVSSLVAGRVAELSVAEGDHVTAGQLIAKIDDRPIRDQLQQAEAAVAQAQANLENARLARERNEALFGRGIVARKELEDARTQQTVAEAALRQTEAARSTTRLQLARAEIHSPLTGTVVKRFVSVGEQVDGTAAQPLVEVAERGEVELFANVPAPYLAKFRLGQVIGITSEAFPGKTFRGRVAAISPSVDPATNVGLVRVRLANEGGLLRLGMFLNAQVPLETHAQALVVPPQAIYRDQQGRPHVYRVEGENAVSVPVTLGIETPERYEILSGVKEGDAIVWTGGYGLGEKTKIKVKP
jgi:RND family efflux transporter MFP subunit